MPGILGSLGAGGNAVAGGGRVPMGMGNNSATVPGGAGSDILQRIGEMGGDPETMFALQMALQQLQQGQEQGQPQAPPAPQAGGNPAAMQMAQQMMQALQQRGAGRGTMGSY